MLSSYKLSSLNSLSSFSQVILYTVLVLFICVPAVFAQANFRTPVIDGVINAQQLEYGNNEENHDRRTSGPVTWWITWDDTRFYIASRGIPADQTSVCYFDRNPVTPTNGGTNSDGTLVDPFDGSGYGTLPFRADYVFFTKGQTRSAFSVSFASNPVTGWTQASPGDQYALIGTEREQGIPWDNITHGNGRPTSFLFLCYAMDNAGAIYGQVPLQNPSGANAQGATATHFYRIFNSLDPINKPPFSTVNSSQPPTAATGTVSGRVTSKSGRAIPGAKITLIGGDGIYRTAISSPFGYYVLPDVPVGGFYIIEIGGSKRAPAYSETRTFNFNEDVNNMNFIVEE